MFLPVKTHFFRKTGLVPAFLRRSLYSESKISSVKLLDNERFNLKLGVQLPEYTGRKLVIMEDLCEKSLLSSAELQHRLRIFHHNGPLEYIRSLVRTPDGSLYKDPIGQIVTENQHGVWTTVMQLNWPESKLLTGIGINKKQSINECYNRAVDLVNLKYFKLSASAKEKFKIPFKESTATKSVFREIIVRNNITSDLKENNLQVKAKNTFNLQTNNNVQIDAIKKPSSKSKKKLKISFSVQNRLSIHKQSLLEPLKLVISPQKLQTQARTFATTPNQTEQEEKTTDLDEITPLDNPQEKQYLVNEETTKIAKQFTNPKHVLHEALLKVSRSLKDPSLEIAPQYKTLKLPKKDTAWKCIYHIKWPESLIFSGKSRTKAGASKKAAVAALLWLKQNGCISPKGKLVLKSDMENVRPKGPPQSPLVVNQSTVKELEWITWQINRNIVPNLVEYLEEDQQDVVRGPVIEPDSVQLNAPEKQRFLGLQTYTAKEKTTLPISAYKEDFMRILKNNRVVIIRGEPGCGKSTRIPQYVLEAWAREAALQNGGTTCRIAVTQPRRIAAISLAERVSSERNEQSGHIVGYQVRFKSSFRQATGRILYCTTGILLRHIQSDQNLSKFTHVILDEAHERDVNTDLLMNLLRSALDTNPKLKLIVMSATIDTKLFQNYFNNAPTMEIPGFTYPVESFFLDSFGRDVGKKTWKMCEGPAPTVACDEVASMIQWIHKNQGPGAILCFLPGWAEISKVENLLPARSDMDIFCLHSRLQDAEQWRIFQRARDGVRKVILSTNIAETSVTIDDVVYVVDSGIHKEQQFDVEKGVNCIDNHWISQANVIQRKGRAGRCQAGQCYHLYPKTKYQQFEKFAQPEILRTSLTKIVLDSKIFTNNMRAEQFMSQLPCPPEVNATLRAVEELIDLELLNEEENLTPLGRTLVDFQLEPKLAKALVNAVIFKCVTPVVDIVTMFSSENEIFSSGLMDKDATKGVKSSYSQDSDHLAMMKIFEKWMTFGDRSDEYGQKRFCEQVGLVPFKMATLEKLRTLHFDYLYNGLRNVFPISDDYSDNDELVKAVLFSGVGTVLKHRTWDIVKNKLKNNVNVFITRNNHKATITSDSVNYKQTEFPSDFLLYINETRSNLRRTTMVRECSFISTISVLLFSNKQLLMAPAKLEDFDDCKVELYLDGTNIKFICDKKQAECLVECKSAIEEVYRYLIFQITKGGEESAEVNEAWDEVLKRLNRVLARHQVFE